MCLGNIWHCVSWHTAEFLEVMTETLLRLSEQPDKQGGARVSVHME